MTDATDARMMPPAEPKACGHPAGREWLASIGVPAHLLSPVDAGLSNILDTLSGVVGNAPTEDRKAVVGWIVRAAHLLHGECLSATPAGGDAQAKPISDAERLSAELYNRAERLADFEYGSADYHAEKDAVLAWWWSQSGIVADMLEAQARDIARARASLAACLAALDRWDRSTDHEVAGDNLAAEIGAALADAARAGGESGA